MVGQTNWLQFQPDSRQVQKSVSPQPDGKGSKRG